LWRLVLPGTAFPACGAAESFDAKERERPSTTTPQDDEARAANPVTER
jgi:hypothetical protein